MWEQLVPGSCPTSGGCRGHETRLCSGEGRRQILVRAGIGVVSGFCLHSPWTVVPDIPVGFLL